LAVTGRREVQQEVASESRSPAPAPVPGGGGGWEPLPTALPSVKPCEWRMPGPSSYGLEATAVR